MKKYKYWSRATENNFAAYGYSDVSEAEANKVADQKLVSIKTAIQNGTVKSWYQYTDRPIREEIKEEVKSGDKLIAIVTRNIYGALIINSENVMFIDIDDNPSRGGLIETVLKLFKKGSSNQSGIVETINGVLMNKGLSGTLYKTKNGHRLLILNKIFDPVSIESEELMTSLNVDPLYARLCKAQECYRARISPKPWNIGFKLPGRGSASFPWKDSATENAHRQWEIEYNSAIQNYSTCNMVADNLGVSEKAIKEVQMVKDLHDKHVLRSGDLA